ncbi:MAG: DUF748 domain-containing protein [Candidatus Omnitrophica bacterium]|nr:DUF748 domain-containing protein [Candidatus Omnitrophota bacterium]
MIIILFAFFAGTAYFNVVNLFFKIRTLIINEVEKATHKKFILQSARFDIGKGFVIEGPIILYDDTSIIIRAKEASCGFFIFPLIKKQVIISAINIESPSLLVERRADSSLNISELIPKGYTSKNGLKMTINRIIIKNGSINFVDKTFTLPFTKKVENVNIDLRPSLPANVAFNFTCEIPSDLPIKVRSSGKYSAAQQELVAQVIINNLSLKEFINYYGVLGLSFPKGTLDATLAIHVKDNIVDADIDARTKNLFISKDKLEAKLDSSINALVQYDIKNRQFEYAGKLDIRAMDIAGIDKVGKLENIKAKIEFNDLRLWSDNIYIDVFDMPWKVKLNLVNLSNPIFDIYATSEARLSVLRKTLEDNFKIKLPIDIAGKSNIELALQMQPNNPPKLNGYVHVHEATISLGSGNFPIEHINGETQFDLNTLKWSNFDFTYHNVRYKASGILTNFASPYINLSIASKDLSFDSIFAVNNKVINFSQLNGIYLNSEFSVTGEVNFEDSDSVDTDISGILEFQLKDLKNIARTSDGIDKMKLEGKLHTEFELSGNIKNIKTCNIDARIKSDHISLYGLKLTDVMLDYIQEKEAGYVKSMSSSFYGGTMWASGKIDWFSKDLPYSLTFNTKDVKLENLKKDTGFKDKDVTGDIKIYANITGLINDSSKLAGIGKISIVKGKLWQLDLFKGLGTLIFTSDFSDIIFTEGSCDFKIENKSFVTNDFSLKSNLLNLYGSAKIGFDRSINASLTSELTEESMCPGARKNIAAAIGKSTFIDISGALSGPKYKVRLNVADLAGEAVNAFTQQ